MDRIAKVSLVRIGAVTHNINMDQRWESLTFRKAGDHVEVDAPSSANDAPPGVYYVFLIDGNGVPSKAAILSISSGADTTAPSVPSGVSASGAIGKSVGELVGVDGQRGCGAVSGVPVGARPGFVPDASTKVGTVTRAPRSRMPGWRRAATTTASSRRTQAGNASAAVGRGGRLTALADTTAPTVALTAPAAGATVHGHGVGDRERER